MVIDSTMLNKLIKSKGFNDEDYETIKESLKNELSFRVAVRRWKRNYAYNQIDIQPYGKGKYSWTEEEFQEIYGFMIRHNLYSYMLYDEKIKNKYIIFSKGFNFVTMIETVKEQQKQQPPSNIINLLDYRKAVN